MVAQIVASKPLNLIFLHPILVVPDWSPSQKPAMTHKPNQGWHQCLYHVPFCQWDLVNYPIDLLGIVVVFYQG
jgi:hypothetical protein